MRRSRWIIALGALLAVGAGAGRVLLRAPAAPPEAEGRAWLSGFADRLTDPRSWAARGPAALALFPGLGSWSDGGGANGAGSEGCVTAWLRRDASAPVVTFQRLELGRLGADPCDQAQFGMLSTTLRSSEGVTAGALVERFTDGFGPPAVHRDAVLRGAVSYRWLLADGIFAQVEEPVGPGAGDAFSVLFVRSYAAPTSLAAPAEGEAWMDRTVDLLTGASLPAARGTAAVDLLGAGMRPQDTGDAGCPTHYASDLLAKEPIATDRTLILELPEGAPCAEARISWLSMRIWRREPVTAGQLARRLEARLGPPSVARDFGRDRIQYRWATPEGMAVELSEDLSAEGRHWLGLRAWRP